MRNNRLFSLIVMIGAMALTIVLVSNARTAATQSASIDEALSLNRHDPRPGVATYVATAYDVGWASVLGDAALSVSSQGSQRSASIKLDQQTRDAIQARWLAQYGGTNRTCVLLCGGW